MSNSNSPKPAMMAIVSAAQKSVSNTSNLSKINNTQVNTQTHSKVAHSKEAQMNITNPQKPTDNKTFDSQKNISQAEKQNIKSSLDAVTKKQEEILKTPAPHAQKNTEPKINTPEKTVAEHTNLGIIQAQNTNKTPDFNQNIVSLLCDGIRNVHHHACDFNEKLRNRRDIKQQSLTHIHTVTCDNIHALSNTCIEAAQKSLKNINPVDLIQNQTKAITQMQTIYANMVSTMSQASLDMMKQNCTFSWFYNSKK